MMLLYVNTPGGGTKLFVGLPYNSLVPSYPGFEVIAENDLPGQPGLLEGHQDEFEMLFPQPK
jgi:hypothetical protein